MDGDARAGLARRLIALAGESAVQDSTPARHPVRVTCIEPGLSGGTEFSLVRFAGDAALAATVYAGTTPLSADDVAEAVLWATGLPPHVNINVIELMPVAQSFSSLAIHRRPAE